MKISKRFLAMLLCLCMLIPLGMTWVSAEEQSLPKASDENVALGKPVEATSGSGESSVTDGNINSYWIAQTVMSPAPLPTLWST